MPGPRPRLLLCDDHHLLVEGLRNLLARRYDVVGVAHDRDGLLDLLAGRTAEADALLLDLSLPGTNGLELIPELRRLRPRLRILVVTQHVDRTLADAAFDAGALGFMPKDSGLDELETAIATVLRGERYLSPRAQHRQNRLMMDAPHPALAALTPRQHEVLRLVARGLSTADIARELGLSEATVTFHRSGIRKALGIESERNLVRWATLMLAGHAPPGAEPAEPPAEPS